MFSLQLKMKVTTVTSYIFVIEEMIEEKAMFE